MEEDSKKARKIGEVGEVVVFVLCISLVVSAIFFLPGMEAYPPFEALIAVPRSAAPLLHPTTSASRFKPQAKVTFKLKNLLSFLRHAAYRAYGSLHGKITCCSNKPR
jgi:hypothetical protein